MPIHLPIHKIIHNQPASQAEFRDLKWSGYSRSAQAYSATLTTGSPSRLAFRSSLAATIAIFAVSSCTSRESEINGVTHAITDATSHNIVGPNNVGCCWPTMLGSFAWALITRII